MSKETKVPVNHGTLCDTINYSELIKRESETPSFNEGKIDNKTGSVKQKVYSKKSRNTNRNIYSSKRQ